MTPPPSQDSERTTYRVLFLTLTGLYALVAFAAFAPQLRLWGLNHLAFYPLFVRVTVLTLVAVTFLPAVHRRVGSILCTILEHRPPVWLMAIVVTGALLLFIGLRSSTTLLGDGRLIVNELNTHFQGGPAGERLKLIAETDRISNGTSVLYFLVTRVLRGDSGDDPTIGIRIINALLGALLVLLSLLSTRRHMARPCAPLWPWVLVVSCGTSQLFFGYVEHYTPMIFFAALYAVLALDTLRTGRRVSLTIAVLGVTIWCHVQAILLLPSAVYLLARTVHAGRGKILPVFVVPSLLALTATAFVAGAMTPLRTHYLPWLGAEKSYGVFSSAHVLDVMNELFLLMPLWPAAVVLGVAAWRLHRSTGRIKAPCGARQSINVQRDPSLDENQPLDAESPDSTPWAFAWLLLIPCLFFLALFDPEIGMCRDWDLFSIASLGMILLGGLAARRVALARPAPSPDPTAAGSCRTASEMVPLTAPNVGHVTRPSGSPLTVPNMAHLAVPAAALGIILAASWIGINASTARSIDRFEHNLVYDRSRADYAYENLARTYEERHRIDRAIWAMEQATTVSPNPRHKLMLSHYYRAYGDAESADELLRRILERRPRYPTARKLLVQSLFDRGRYEELTEVAREGTQRHPQKPLYYYYLGKSLLALGKTKPGRDALAQSKLRGLGEPMRSDADFELGRTTQPSPKSTD